METPGERLRYARERAGYATAQEFAEAVGSTVSTYRSHENGTRGIPNSSALQYAKKLKIEFDWLQAGQGQTPEVKKAPDAGRNARDGLDAPPAYAAIPVADVRAGMGGPGAIMSDQPIAYRYFPEEELRALRVKPENLWCHRADGTSMAPDFQDGDLLVIDTSQRNPSPPRIFTIWDGFGLVTKYVERVIGSSPPRVRLLSMNPAFPPYEVTIGDRGELEGEEAFIVGRVVFVQRAL